MMKKAKKILCVCLSVALAMTQLPIDNVSAASKNDLDTVGQNKDEYLREYLRKSKTRSKGASESSERTMIANDYLEFMVDDNGRFTIGNVEGNSNYSSDDNQILLYGHSDPGTSFSTIRIQSNRDEMVDLKFQADTNTYDTENKIVTSVMHVEDSFESGEAYDFTITQYLEFVSGGSGIGDTVKISYTLKNNGVASQKAGMRIMLDTMLADNDDAPFKVLGYGQVTSELELTGSNLPSTYQVYDNLDNPTTFATGTLYLENDRIPDKVQFARWDYITDSLYDYSLNQRNFGDSAVAVYFDPVTIGPAGDTSVCTYYGVNSNLTSDGSGIAVDDINESQYGVLVYDSLSQQYIEGAKVTIEGVSVATDGNGLAVFDDYVENNGKEVTVKVSKAGYKTIEVPRNILCGSFTGVGIVSENSAAQEPSVLSAVMQSGTNMYDLLTSYVYYDEADQDDEKDEVKKDSILIRVVNAGTANTYRLVQAGKVKYESKDGTFTIPVVTADKDGNAYSKPRIIGLSAGEDVKLQMVNDGLGVTSTNLLGLKISTPTLKKPGDEKGSITIGDNINFKIPDSVPIFGGAEMKFGTVNPCPIEIKVEQGGKFRVAVGSDLGNDWDEFEKNYMKMREEIDNTSKYQEVANAFGLGKFVKDTYGAGSLDFECKLTGYGEGVADANGNLNIELGIILAFEEEGSYTQYFFLVAVPVYLTIGEKGELVTQIKGNLVYGDNNFSFVGGDCTIEPSFELSVEGGVGIKGALSASAEGSAKLKWLHRFVNNYNRVSLSGAITFKLTLLLFSAEKSFDSDSWTIYETDANSRRRMKNLKNLYEESDFRLSKREALDNMDSTDNLTLESMYTGIQEVTVNGKQYRFYLAADNTRGIANRTTVVYQKFENGVWTEPVQIDNDGTSDINFSLAIDNNNIYVVWENMGKSFNTDVTLEEMIKSSQIKLCKIDTGNNDAVTTLFTSSNDQVGDFSPCIAVTSNKNIKIAWYSNSQNDILGNTLGNDASENVNVVEGKDCIYYVDISVNGDSGNSNTKIEKIEIDKGRVIALAAGCLNKKDSIVYSLDSDGDFNTDRDIVLYAYNNTSSEGVALTNTDSASTGAKFAILDGQETMFYYSSGNIAYTANGKEEDTVYIFDKNEVPLGISDSFCVISNETGDESCVLWKNSDGENGQNIYAAYYQNSKWSKPFILTTVEGKDVSIPSGYIDSDGNFILSYGYNEVSDNGSNAVIERKKIKRFTDVHLDNVSIDQESVKPGSDLDLNINISNAGLTDVESINVAVYKDNELLKQQDVVVNLGMGIAASYEIKSAFKVPAELNGVTEYTVKVSVADKEYGAKKFSIGYTDISVTENARYMVADDEYVALKVSNLSNFSAKNIRLRVLADSLDGTVIYDSYIQDLAGDTEKVYNINVNQLSNSRIAYAIVSCESPEYYSYNNTELIAVNPYLKRAEIEVYRLTISAQEGGKIVAGASGNYAVGTKINVKAEANPGYKFAGWAAEAGTFDNALNSATTFVMPGEAVSVIAKFQKNTSSSNNNNNSSGSSNWGETLIWPAVTLAPTASPVASPTPSSTPSVEPSVIPEATNTPVPPSDNATPVPTPINTLEPNIPITTSEPNMLTDDDDNTTSDVRKGEIVSVSGMKYKVASVKGTRTVNLIGVKKNSKKITIPSAVTIKGKKYKITSIANNACKACKKLAKITVGANVNSIGKNAFKGCKNLKKIIVKTKKLTLKRVGSNAFKGINKKALFKVPKSKVKIYKKIVRAKGAGKNVRVKK